VRSGAMSNVEGRRWCLCEGFDGCTKIRYENPPCRHSLHLWLIKPSSALLAQSFSLSPTQLDPALASQNMESFQRTFGRSSSSGIPPESERRMDVPTGSDIDSEAAKVSPLLMSLTLL